MGDQAGRTSFRIAAHVGSKTAGRHFGTLPTSSVSSWQSRAIPERFIAMNCVMKDAAWLA